MSESLSLNHPDGQVRNRVQSNWLFQPSVFNFSTFFNTSASRSFLYATTFLPMVSSNEPMIEAARIPAFFAAFKATVATGTPLGICKIDKTESHPSMELED